MLRGERAQFLDSRGQWRLCTVAEWRQLAATEDWSRVDVTPRLAHWCDDPSIWPVLLGLYEKLSQGRVRRPPDAEERVHVERYLRVPLTTGRGQC